MGNYVSSGKEEDIKSFYDVIVFWERKHNTKKCKRIAKRLFEDSAISHKEYQLLAERGCLGPKEQELVILYNNSKKLHEENN